MVMAREKKTVVMMQKNMTKKSKHTETTRHQNTHTHTSAGYETRNN